MLRDDFDQESKWGDHIPYANIEASFFFLAPTSFRWTFPFQVPNKVQPSKSQFGYFPYRTGFN